MFFFLSQLFFVPCCYVICGRLDVTSLENIWMWIRQTAQKCTTPSVTKYMVYCFIPSGRWLKSEVSSIRLLLYSPSAQLCKPPTNCNQRLLLYSLRTGALVTLPKPNSNPKTFRRGALTTHLIPCFFHEKRNHPIRHVGCVCIQWLETTPSV